ncbi:hypothetical protein V6N12_003205 [Hibiscus sabdariffa]|uniref:RNase H type-1 domain-containing protein n=1 Tax=Hibiscus sabdariffa TaxID=183260 RepID=A0ABR2ECZ1_9ROSI
MVDNAGEWDWGHLSTILPCEILQKIATAKPPNFALGKDMPGWCWEHDHRFSSKHVQLEVDNLEVVQILLKQSDALTACALVEAISSLLNRSWSVQVQHIPREKNLVADRNAAISRSGPIAIPGDVPASNEKYEIVVLSV